MIILNMLWIGIDLDYNQAAFLCDAPFGFQFMENLFCSFFTVELMIRFLSFSVKRHCLQEGWFMFDAFLVIFMVWDTWIVTAIHSLPTGFGVGSTMNTSPLRVLRLLRLMRVARMARVLRRVPEFMILVKGMGVALRSVTSMLGLLVLIMYVFSIIFTELFRDSNAAAGIGFETVMESMNTLLLHCILVDQGDILQKLLDKGVTYYVVMVIFLVLTTMTVFNMLIGVMCEQIGGTAEYEREALLVEQVKERVQEILPELDEDGDGMISKSEFANMLNFPDCVRVLSEFDVDVIALVDFSEYIFGRREEITYGELMATVMKFRGGQQVTVRDVVDCREFLANEINSAFRSVLAIQAQTIAVATTSAREADSAQDEKLLEDLKRTVPDSRARTRGCCTPKIRR
jgi:hypothetical protein